MSHGAVVAMSGFSVSRRPNSRFYVCLEARETPHRKVHSDCGVVRARPGGEAMKRRKEGSHRKAGRKTVKLETRRVSKRKHCI